MSVDYNASITLDKTTGTETYYPLNKTDANGAKYFGNRKAGGVVRNMRISTKLNGSRLSQLIELRHIAVVEGSPKETLVQLTLVGDNVTYDPAVGADLLQELASLLGQTGYIAQFANNEDA